MEFQPKHGNRECRISNSEKYLTADTGNPTQKHNRKCIIPNFEKYSTAEAGNPTQNSNRKYRIPNIEKYLAAKTGNPTKKWLSDRDYLIATGRDLIPTISFRSSSNV